MKKIALVILLMSTGCLAIGKQKKATKKTTNQNDIVSVSIYHTACYGRCPEYKVEVNKNGTATYTGIRFVPDSGVYTKKIGVAAAKEVIAPFLKYKLDTFQDRYESLVQDLPGMVMTVKYANRTKTIQNPQYGPNKVGSLTVKLDSILQRKMDESGLLPLDKSWRRTGNYKYE